MTSTSKNASEKRALLRPAERDARREAGKPERTAFAAASLGILVLAACVGLIIFNKQLMGESQFPFAAHLALAQMAVASVFTGIMFFLWPGLFPSLTDPEKRVEIDHRLFFLGLVPVSVFSSLQVVLSNLALRYSTVAFLQMLKQANVVLLYIFSIAAAFEVFRLRNTAFLSLVGVATWLAMSGEVHFSFAGFMAQGLSCAFESLKITLLGFVLSSSGKYLDPLTYVLVTSPLCCLWLLLGILAGHSGAFGMSMPMPLWSDFSQFWLLLLLNGTIAFVLNLVMASFVRYTSPVAFGLTSLLKDLLIVVAGGIFLRENISIQQAAAFISQLGLLYVWSMMRMFPSEFEGGIFKGFASLLWGKQSLFAEDSAKV